MKVFVVIVSDRHTDDALYLYSVEASALSRAERETQNMLEHYRSSADELDTDLNDSMQRSGWLYYASLEDAGSVRVETHELITA